MVPVPVVAVRGSGEVGWVIAALGSRGQSWRGGVPQITPLLPSLLVLISCCHCRASSFSSPSSSSSIVFCFGCFCLLLHCSWYCYCCDFSRCPRFFRSDFLPACHEQTKCPGWPHNDLFEGLGPPAPIADRTLLTETHSVSGPLLIRPTQS